MSTLVEGREEAGVGALVGVGAGELGVPRDGMAAAAKNEETLAEILVSLALGGGSVSGFGAELSLLFIIFDIWASIDSKSYTPLRKVSPVFGIGG